MVSIVLMERNIKTNLNKQRNLIPNLNQVDQLFNNLQADDDNV